MGSDGGYKHRSNGESAREIADLRNTTDAELVPDAAGSAERSWPITDPLRIVRAERRAAAAQIGRSMRAWRKEAGPGSGSAQIPQSGGAPLPANVRNRMEPKLGADLSDVKIHTGGDSADAARALGARAMTVGSDVHFADGEFAPGTKDGDRLLAHELTHVVQGQKSGAPVQRKPEEAAGAHDGAEAQDVSQPGEPAEQEADAVGDRVASELHSDAKHEGDGRNANSDGRGGEAGKGNGQAANSSKAGHGAGGDRGAGGKGTGGSGGAKHDGKTSGAGNASAAAHAKGTDGKGPESGAKGGASADDPATASAGANGASGHKPDARESQAEAKQDAKQEAKQDASKEAQANGGGAPVAEKPVAPISAKLSGAGRKIYRQTRPPTTPPPNSPNASTSSTPGNPPTAPAQTWNDWVNTSQLPTALKTKAMGLGPTEQPQFKTLLAPEQESYLSLNGAAQRAEFFGFDNQTRAKVRVLRLEKADHFNLYDSEADQNVRRIWRDLTPDERNDLTKSGMAGVRDYLTNTNGKSLEKFRKDRNLALLQSNPALMTKLAGALTLNDVQTQDAVSALSAGQGGERLRRVMADTGFERESDKFSFIKQVWQSYTAAAGTKDPISCMWEARPSHVMKGKPSKNDAAFNNVPIAKAISLASIAKYGTLTEGVVEQMARSAKQNPAEYGAAASALPAPQPGKEPLSSVAEQAKAKRADQGFRDAFVAPVFPKFAKGRFSKAMVDSYTIAGARGAASYWSADANMCRLVMAGAEDDAIIKACAIDESPEYQHGFIVVRMPTATKQAWAAKAQGIRRPTAVDGLGFDQFKDAGDESKCIGVTSGGMPEVVIEPVPLASVDVIRQ